MTDARLKGEWLTAPAHDGLSDAAYRIFHNALMHSSEQGTDGAISARELRFLYPGPIDPAWLGELQAAGFWEPTDDGYQMIGWADALGQSTAAEVEEYRRKARERQRKRRNTLKAASGTGKEPQGLSPEVVTRDVTRDVARDVGQARTGQARPVPSTPVRLTEIDSVHQSSPHVTAREERTGRFDLARFRAERPDLGYLPDDSVSTLANETLGRASGDVSNETAYVLRAARDPEWVKRAVDLGWAAAMREDALEGRF